jgi:hypothetical protein
MKPGNTFLGEVLGIGKHLHVILSPEILTKILKGADKISSRLRDDCWLILDAQGLIPK